MTVSMVSASAGGATKKAASATVLGGAAAGACIRVRGVLSLASPSGARMSDAVAKEDQLKITLLGTGIPNPQINHWDFHADRGRRSEGDDRLRTRYGDQLSQIGLGVGCVDTIIISHYHSDHYAGLFDMAMTGSIPQKLAVGTRRSRCWPPGIKDIAEGAWLATGRTAPSGWPTTRSTRSICGSCRMNMPKGGL